MGAFAVANLNLEATTIITFEITQPFKGANLRVIYLAERINY